MKNGALCPFAGNTCPKKWGEYPNLSVNVAAFNISPSNVVVGLRCIRDLYSAIVSIGNAFRKQYHGTDNYKIV